MLMEPITCEFTWAVGWWVSPQPSRAMHHFFPLGFSPCFCGREGLKSCLFLTSLSGAWEAGFLFLLEGWTSCSGQICSDNSSLHFLFPCGSTTLARPDSGNLWICCLCCLVLGVFTKHSLNSWEALMLMTWIVAWGSSTCLISHGSGPWSVQISAVWLVHYLKPRVYDGQACPVCLPASL